MAQTIEKMARHTGAHPAFEWLRSESIESLNLLVEEYRHRATGALHYHLASDNTENVFLVALRTVPMDSSGVAHILEHTVLCGSERYPVRDPFFMMIRRSLNTFMNAFTSSDWTAYPFASQNRKDFDNLLSVYLDAVFFARLDELDFAQEGHRLEFEVPDQPSSPLRFKGVVYNEMKGAMSSPVNTLWHTLSRYLFPSTTYHYNSGGEPEHIPDLSYDQLKDFYRTHYHPSNAVFMTYGDIPAPEHQERFEELALSRFERLDDTVAVGDEKRYQAPVRVEESYAVEAGGEPGKQTHVVLGWLLGRSTDLDTQLRVHLLSDVLLDNSSSPLRHALETTDLGSAPSPLCGVEDSNREMSFLCGLEGAAPESADAIEAMITGVLRRVAEEGVPQEQVDAMLHQLELSQREIGGDSYPYGLQLALNALPAAVHHGDPVAMLNLDPALERLRRDAADPDFIKQLVRDLLLDNQHLVRLSLKPDAGLGGRRERAETARLEAIKQTLTDAEARELVERAKSLAERQRQTGDEDVLPRVGLEDVPATLHIPSGLDTAVGGLPLTVYEQGTNGLVYQEIVVDLPRLDDELLSVMPYFTNCITELGCGERDYLQTQAWQASVSGGVSAFTSVRGGIEDEQAVRGHFVLSGKALARNHLAFTELMRKTIREVRFDEVAHIREVVSQQRARREQAVTGSGHVLAMSAACSGMSPTAHLQHRLRGLEGIRAIKRLDDLLRNDGELRDLADKMSRLHGLVLAAPTQLLLVAESDRRSALVADLERCWSASGGAGSSRGDVLTLEPVRESVRQLWVTSTQVNFCAMAYPTVPIDHPDAAALAVLGGFLRNGFLHRAVREQGGAYGGGAGQDSDIAAFRFYSYRDPRLGETLKDFERSVDWLLTGRHESRQVEEAILGVISSIDKPGSPSGEARSAFHNALYGRTAAQRQNARARVLQVTLKDLQRVGETYLKTENASVAVLTNAKTLDQFGDLGLQVKQL